MPLEEKGMAVRVVEFLPSSKDPLGVTGQVTAQVQGVVTARQDWLSGFVISGLANTGTGAALDARRYAAGGYVWAQASGCSASATLLASHDSAGWIPVTSFGLAHLATSTAQVSGLYPFIAGRVDNAYNNGGGATAITATVWMHVTRT